MGTNYYARISKVDANYQELETLTKTYAPHLTGLLDALKPKDDLIHLGKSSSGWAFTFDHNDWKFYNDWTSFKDFIHQVEIEDEYGIKISTYAFIDVILSGKDDKFAQAFKIEFPEDYIKIGDMWFSAHKNFF